MVNKKAPNVLFLGLTHLGQVYSTTWRTKVGPCAVYDFQNKNLENFKQKKFTNEELDLKNFERSKKFTFLCSEEEIKKYEFIFFCYDTPINVNSGKPNISLIDKYLKKLTSIQFEKKTYIFITSQVYPGYTKKKLKKISNKKINLIYMVDTLIMGIANKRFFHPERIILGSNNDINKQKINKFFKHFKCPKYFFSLEEAELIKVSINMFLFFSVSFANMIDEFGKNLNINFSKINHVLKNDKRIGNKAYINPSIGISGGHLERDLFYFLNKSNNHLAKNIIKTLFKFNDKRKKIFEEKISKMRNIKKILIVGISYKENSFSITNSIFKSLINNKKYKFYAYDSSFEIDKKIKINVVKNLNNIKKYNLVIFNYAKKKDFNLIKKFVLKNKKIYLMNISNKFKFIDAKNTLNYFPK